MQPHVSIIVPVYNTEPYIAKCLATLTGQTMQELEFIFVDDRGSDKSMKIVRRYAEKDARIRIITNEKNLGAGESRNAGLRIATGEYVTFIDSDDWVSANYFYELYKTAIDHNADIAKGRVVLVWKDRESNSEINGNIQERIQKREFPGIAFTHEFGTAIYRLNVLRNHHIDFPVLSHGEDCVFLVKALCATKTIALTDKAVYYYYQREYSSSQTINQQYYSSLFQHYGMIVSILKEYNLSTHDLVEYWHHAILNPLRFHHIPQIKRIQDDVKSVCTFIFEQLQCLLETNNVYTEMCAAYPDSFYQKIKMNSPMELTYQYMSDLQIQPMNNQPISASPPILRPNRPMYKLAIITVCFNEKNIDSTCLSITQQTWQDFEWIVIDGGSNHETLSALEKYRDRMSVFISEKDTGIYNAMNKGILNANSEYLLFLNGGDYFLDPFALERMFSYEDWKEDLICSDALFIRDDGTALFKTFSHAFPLSPDFLKHDSLSHPSTIIRKDLFTRYGGYNENRRIVSDWEKWIEFIVVHHASCRYFNRILSIHHYTGISSHDSPEHRKERSDVLCQYAPFFNQYKTEEISQAAPNEPHIAQKKKEFLWSKVLLFHFIPLLRITRNADFSKFKLKLFNFIPFIKIIIRR